MQNKYFIHDDIFLFMAPPLLMFICYVITKLIILRFVLCEFCKVMNFLRSFANA